MLSIANLHVAVGDKSIPKGPALDVPAGGVHAIMGPNGARTFASCYDSDRRMP